MPFWQKTRFFIKKMGLPIAMTEQFGSEGNSLFIQKIDFFQFFSIKMHPGGKKSQILRFLIALRQKFVTYNLIRTEDG